jgi:hypothetical protein
VKWSQPLKRWFEAVAGDRGLRVPEFVWGSAHPLQTSYIQGLFDTDGWVNAQGTVGINMRLEARPFLQEVQLLLQGLGIDSAVSERKQQYKYKGQVRSYRGVVLWIRGRDSRRAFEQRIGFTESAKHSKLVASLDKAERSNRRGTTTSYNLPETFLTAYRQVHPRGSTQDKRVPRYVFDLPRRVQKEGRVSRQGVEWLLKMAQWRGIESAALRHLAQVVQWQVMRVRVVSAAGSASVWVLEVSGDHEYQTGPILSHNSSDIVTASWVDEELEKASEVLYQCLKSRDNAKFDPFRAKVVFNHRRILTLEEADQIDAAKIGEALDASILDDIGT